MRKSTLQNVCLILAVLSALLWTALPALAQDPTSPAVQTALAGTPGLDETAPAPEPTSEPTPTDELPEIPSGLWIVFSGMFRDAIGQGFAMIRDLGLITFGGLFIAFCIFIVVFVKYIAPLIPKGALDVVREAGKDGLAIAKVELDRRHEEAKKTESPFDDAVVESLKILHTGILAILNMTSTLAQNLVPAGQVSGQAPQVTNIYTSAPGDPEKIAAEVQAALADVARPDAVAVDEGDARG